MENLQQIVVQITTAENVRALVQYGQSLIPENQINVLYSELSPEDKQTWDAFVSMIQSKNN